MKENRVGQGMAELLETEPHTLSKVRKKGVNRNGAQK